MQVTLCGATVATLRLTTSPLNQGQTAGVIALSREDSAAGQMTRMTTLIGHWYKSKTTSFFIVSKIKNICITQGRGSRNPSTGPAMDRSSFVHGGNEGGYAFIDSSHPRRPGDVARLSSLELDATGEKIS